MKCNALKIAIDQFSVSHSVEDSIRICKVTILHDKTRHIDTMYIEEEGYSFNSNTTYELIEQLDIKNEMTLIVKKAVQQFDNDYGISIYWKWGVK